MIREMVDIRKVHAQVAYHQLFLGSNRFNYILLLIAVY